MSTPRLHRASTHLRKLSTVAWTVFGLTMALAPPSAAQTPYKVLGTSFKVSDPQPGVAPTKRKIIVRAKDLSGLIDVLGNPIDGGATLRIIANGAVDTDQMFSMPATGWVRIRGGYQYAGPRAVAVARIKNSSAGTFTLQFVLKGDRGESIEVVPPAPGTDGGARFIIGGFFGAEYDVAFGGGAGGTVINAPATTTDKLFKITRPSDVGCPEVANPVECGPGGYPTCDGDCPCGLECMAVSYPSGHTVCLCERAGSRCPTGQAEMLDDFGEPMGCAPTPTCWENAVTYPTCDGGVPPPFVCQAVARFGDVPKCIAFNSATTCDSTCPSLNVDGGVCPTGEVCFVSDSAAPGRDCGCAPADSNCYDSGGVCGGVCPSGASCFLCPAGVCAPFAACACSAD